MASTSPGIPRASGRGLLGALASLIALVGCGAEGDGARRFPDRFLDQPVAWRACPLDEATGAGDGECADVIVPVDWAAPAGDTLSLRLKRRLAGPDATRQLWLHEGGPGGSSVTDFGPLLNEQPDLFPDADLYLMDHRGTGESSFLVCPEEYRQPGSDWDEGISYVEWGECAADLAAARPPLAAFTVTAAARDAALVAELLRRPDRALFHFGVSYGTYLVSRYAQLYPDQPAGVILDSVVTPTMSFAAFDARADAVAAALFARCADDATCRAHLGDEPLARARQVLQDFGTGHCPEAAAALVPDGLSSPVAYLQILAYSLARDWSARLYLPVLYHRLGRCAPHDVAALQSMIDRVLYVEPSVYDTQSSTVIFNHISLSELAEGLQADPAVAWSELQGYLVASLVEYRLAEIATGWPVYRWDEHHGAFPPPRVPILALNGTLDLQTPIASAREVEALLTGPHQHFVTIPGGGHGVLLASPVLTPDADPCGAQIVQSFLADPTVAPDTGCLEDLRPVDFVIDPSWSDWLLGTPDTWGDGAPAPRPAPGVAPPPRPAPRWRHRPLPL